jgi:4a-hydroxytetrahydrobiopterin dehydratase
MATSDPPPPRAAAYAAISPEDAYRALAGHPAWIVERDRLHRDIRLRSFMEAIDLITRVAATAEVIRHHPNIRLHEWCFVDFEVYSHLTGGISSRDVELALAIDKLIEDTATA